MIMYTIRKSLIPWKIFSILVPILMFMMCARIESDDIPTEPTTLLGLIDEGMVAFQNQEYENAIDLFNQALERDVDPVNALRAYQGLGWTYSRINRPSRAVDKFNFILSIENLATGKQPVIFKTEQALSRSRISFSDSLFAADTLTKVVIDTFGTGFWMLDLMDKHEYLLGVDAVNSYTAEFRQHFAEGAEKAVIAGTEFISLEHSPLGDSTGAAEATSTNNSLLFLVDTLTSPVASPDQLINLYDYYLDTEEWNLQIIPRYWDIPRILSSSAYLKATYLYFEDEYSVRNYNFQSISLNADLQTGDKFPILKPTEYPGGKVFYIEGRYFNAAAGGSKNMLDAYAGLASAYLVNSDYQAAIEAARTAILINEYQAGIDSSYLYERQLFSGDDGMSLWHVYHIMATAYLNIGDYSNAFAVIEALGGDAPVVDDTYHYLFDALSELGSLNYSNDWTAPDIW